MLIVVVLAFFLIVKLVQGMTSRKVRNRIQTGHFFVVNAIGCEKS